MEYEYTGMGWVNNQGWSMEYTETTGSASLALYPLPDVDMWTAGLLIRNCNHSHIYV